MVFYHSNVLHTFRSQLVSKAVTVIVPNDCPLKANGGLLNGIGNPEEIEQLTLITNNH